MPDADVGDLAVRDHNPIDDVADDACLLGSSSARAVALELGLSHASLLRHQRRLVVQSTPADEVGDFYELVQARDLAMSHYAVRSDEVPTITAAFLAAERRAMGPDAFAAEYECQFARAGAALFTAARINSLILPDEVPA